MNRRQFTLMMSSLPMLSFANWTGASSTPSALKTFVRTNWSQDPFALGLTHILLKTLATKTGLLCSNLLEIECFLQEKH